MRLWVFLLFTVIASAVAIWGCIMTANTLEPLTEEVSFNDSISQNRMSNQSEDATNSSLTSDFVYQ